MNLIGQKKRATLAESRSLKGIGLQSGKECSITLCPRKIAKGEGKRALDQGIYFQRSDLPGAPEIPALIEFRSPGSFRTTDLTSNEATVGTVEHVMAALKIKQIDDVLIKVSGPEIPICDGSARAFIELIEKCGRQMSLATKEIYSLSQPMALRLGQTQMIATPNHTFEMSCLINYPQNSLINCQYFTLPIHEDKATSELAPARTFCLLKEAEMMRAQGKMLGGDLSNAVVISEKRVMNEEGLRFSDEMVRHKMLDCLGDLALIGSDLNAHIIAICPSHEANANFARMIKQKMRPTR